MNNLMTVEDVAKKLQMSERKVYLMVAAGYMPHFRIDRLIRFTDEHLEQFLAGREGGGNGTEADAS